MLKQILQYFSRWLSVFGFDTRKTINSVRGLRKYFRDLNELNCQKTRAVRQFSLGTFYPCLDDHLTQSGSAKGHYFHQDLLVASRVFLNNPTLHVDVGSRVDGLVAHIATFREIEVIDIRPLTSNVRNIRFIKADMMSPVATDMQNYCDSLSCLHALEHFGLGRYGDPIVYDGYISGLNNLHRLLKREGKFYLSVPIGPQRIEFNAHRVFSLHYLLECLLSNFRLDCFSFVDDKGELHENIILSESNIQSNCGCHYGCGIFELTKL